MGFFPHLPCWSRAGGSPSAAMSPSRAGRIVSKVLTGPVLPLTTREGEASASSATTTSARHRARQGQGAIRSPQELESGELNLFHGDAALAADDRQGDERADPVAAGRAGVAGGDATVAHVAGDVPVAERDVVARGAGDL